MALSRYPVQALFRAWIICLILLPLVLAGGYFFLRGPESPAQSIPAQEKAVLPPQPPVTVPAFNATDAPLLVSAFSLSGLHLTDDGAPLLSIREPGSRFVVQVLARGAAPEVLADEARVLWRLDAPYAAANPPSARQGEASVDKEGPAFVSESIPLAPLAKNVAFAPYPTALVRVLRGTAAEPGKKEDAETRLVLPVSAEMGCRNCHGGPWKHEGGFGLSEQTARDILAVHDRRNNTSLLDGEQGPVRCAACHSGQGDQPNLSAALHGFHAAMRPQGAEACDFCHASGQDGQTRFFRGLHDMWGLDCSRCHGNLAEHALSLLRHEAGRGVKAAAVRLARLSPLVERAGDIKPRQPEENLPQCAGCHDFKVKPDPDEASAFNKWTASASERFTRAKDNTGLLRCPSCHGAPHALYPARNPAGDERDNIQPLQYQGMAAPLGKDGNCAVCHTMAMEYFIHHDRPE